MKHGKFIDDKHDGFTNKWVVNGNNYGINFRKLEENSYNYGELYNYNLQLLELRSQVIFVGFSLKFGE